MSRKVFCFKTELGGTFDPAATVSPSVLPIRHNRLNTRSWLMLYFQINEI